MSNRGFISFSGISGPWDSWSICNQKISLSVYSVNWDFNDSASPSSLRIGLISEDGYYNYNNLNSKLNESRYKTKFNITIGAFSFQGYFTDFTIEKTPEQKLLWLEFVDIGADLDRWYVGLHARHGDNGIYNSDRLIICGKEYSPCDSNLDSNVAYKATNGVAVDPCDPCPTMPPDKYKVSCNNVNAYFNIWETWYTFNELILKLQTIFKNSAGEISVSIDNANLNNTFRSQHVGKLKDVLSAWCSDLGLSYYWDPISSKLVFVDRKKVLSIPEYDVLSKDSNIIDLKYGNTAKSTFSRGFLGFFSKEGNVHQYSCSSDPFNSFYTLRPAISYNQDYVKKCGLAYYSKALFSAWSWLNNGGAEIGIGRYSTIEDGNTYEWLNSAVLSEDQISAYGGRGKYYYIIAECDEDAAQVSYEYYQNAANILGKYWITNASFPYMAGAFFDSHSSVQIDSPGGSAKFFTSYNDLSAAWPIDVSNYSIYFGAKNVGAIGMERQSSWWPQQGDSSASSAASYWEYFVPKAVGSDGRPPELFQIKPNAAANEKIFVVPYAPTAGMRVSVGSDSNPNEPGVSYKLKSINNAFGGSVDINLGSYGLVTNSCIAFSISGFTFYAPVGATGSGAVKVFVDSSDTFKIALPKVQQTIKYTAGTNSNVAQIDYHYHEARENNLSLFNNAKDCVPSSDNIETYFKNISKNSYYAQNNLQKNASFKIPGICPTLYKIEQGLASMQISLTSNGFFTTYNLEDKIILPPSDEYLTQSLIARTIPRTSVARQYLTSTDSKIISS